MIDLRKKMEFVFKLSPLTALGREKTLLYSVKKGFTSKDGFPQCTVQLGVKI